VNRFSRPGKRAKGEKIERYDWAGQMKKGAGCKPLVTAKKRVGKRTQQRKGGALKVEDPALDNHQQEEGGGEKVSQKETGT